MRQKMKKCHEIWTLMPLYILDIQHLHWQFSSSMIVLRVVILTCMLICLAYKSIRKISSSVEARHFSLNLTICSLDKESVYTFAFSKCFQLNIQWTENNLNFPSYSITSQILQWHHLICSIFTWHFITTNKLYPFGLYPIHTEKLNLLF